MVLPVLLYCRSGAITQFGGKVEVLEVADDTCLVRYNVR